MWFRLSERWAERHRQAIRTKMEEVVRELARHSEATSGHDENANAIKAALSSKLSVLIEKDDIYRDAFQENLIPARQRQRTLPGFRNAIRRIFVVHGPRQVSAARLKGELRNEGYSELEIARYFPICMSTMPVKRIASGRYRSLQIKAPSLGSAHSKKTHKVGGFAEVGDTSSITVATDVADDRSFPVKMVVRQFLLEAGRPVRTGDIVQHAREKGYARSDAIRGIRSALRQMADEVMRMDGDYFLIKANPDIKPKPIKRERPKQAYHAGGGFPIKQFLVQCLRDAGEPMRVVDMLAYAREHGYSAKAGQATISVTLRTYPDEFVRAGWGMYTLVELANRGKLDAPKGKPALEHSDREELARRAVRSILTKAGERAKVDDIVDVVLKQDLGYSRVEIVKLLGKWKMVRLVTPKTEDKA